jgi:hypothetical protein
LDQETVRYDKVRNILCAGLLALSGCGLAEWRDVASDAAVYNGKPPTTDPGTVAIDTALKAAEKASSPLELGAYIGGLLATVAAGWVGRKWVLKKYAK